LPATTRKKAKQKVTSLVQDLGFEVRDAGPLKAARLLEPLAMVWIDQALRYGMPADLAWALIPRQ
jgi:predicted dinucleotide-binding enzyme